MEWVETTGKTVEDAKEAALDQLGVHEDDAEFEVVEEPRAGLFGRMRGEARVRARVRPTQPRPKTERRDRKRRKPEGPKRAGGAEKPASGANGQTEGSDDEPAAAGPSNRRRSRGGRGRGRGSSTAASAAAATSTRRNEPNDQEGNEMTIREGNDVTVEEQAAIMRSFVEGLVDAFDLEAEFVEDRVDDETIELKVQGDNLGLLIGPKGQTLQSVQELARTVVQRQATGTHF